MPNARLSTWKISRNILDFLNDCHSDFRSSNRRPSITSSLCIYIHIYINNRFKGSLCTVSNKVCILLIGKIEKKKKKENGKL